MAVGSGFGAVRGCLGGKRDTGLPGHGHPGGGRGCGCRRRRCRGALSRARALRAATGRRYSAAGCWSEREAAVGPGSRGAAGPGSTWGGANRGTPRPPARPWLLNRADCVERIRRKRDKYVRLGEPFPPVWFSSLALRILLYLRFFKPMDRVFYYLTSPNNVERLLFCTEGGPEPRFPARK